MVNSIIENVKLKIKNILKSRKMSIYSLATQADISEACIRNWYNKRNYVPSLESLCKICTVLNISLSYLFATEEDNLYPVDKSMIEVLENYAKLDNSKRDSFAKLLKSITKE